MNHFFIRIVAMLFFLLPLTATATNWKIVPEKSTLSFTAIQNNAPVLGSFKTFSGDIIFDPDQLATSSVNIVVDINSVETSYSQVAETLKTPDWFNVNVFPKAIFKATTFTKAGDNTYQANGLLTIRNKTIPVVITFSLEKYSATEAYVKGYTTLKRTAFNVGMGDWASTEQVKDDVEVKFILEAIPK